MIRLIFALGILAGAASHALAQTPRSLLPQEVVTSVPASVTSAADKAAIAEFIETRLNLLQRILDRSQASCPVLLEGELTVREFAEKVDREEAASRADIATAWAHAKEKMTLRGQAEVDLFVEQAQGYTIEGNLTAAYDAEPHRLEQVIRWRCEVGFAEAGSVPEQPTFIGKEIH